MLQVTWLKEILEKNMRLIVVVRDPHDWIHSLTRDDLTGERKIEFVLIRIDSRCQCSYIGKRKNLSNPPLD